MTPLGAVILAAGKGTRMRSGLPKALHGICGRPMTEFLIQRAKEAGSRKTLVIAGYQFDRVRQVLGAGAQVVRQKNQWGSGHAVQQSAGAFSSFNGSVLVLYCDTPLITTSTLKKLLENHRTHGTDCTFLSVDSSAPKGYGRVKRNAEGLVEKIVEEPDASPEEKAIREINVGCYLFRAKKLYAALKHVQKNSVKKEYYLTDVVEILSRQGRVEAVKTEDQEEVLGINTRVDLSRVQEIMQRRLLEAWMERGVSVRDVKTTFIDSGVKIGQDTVLLPHTVIEEGSQIGDRCVIGPFARIRGASRIGSDSVIGNFVEIVRTTIGRNTQVKHLTYLGDAKIGDFVNIGAGTITANFDGKSKHTTVIYDRAQIGSGTILVAPVTVGRGAKTGAGAVVTKGTRVKNGAVYVGMPAKELKRKE
jgi:bifunctional UDP-N-acetylglucosamine pyrophosphorylase/glucosamine-1-phosphate N-acetyltransferase